MVDKFKKQIKRFFAPIIAHQGWEDVVTEKMKTKIQIERLRDPSAETATDYEAMVYLHTASLATPLSQRWYNIYSFLFSEYHPKQAKEIGVYKKQVTEFEKRELSHLKKWIYKKSIRNERI